MRKSVLFVGLAGLVIVLILATGCLRAASPDVTPTPAVSAHGLGEVPGATMDATAMAAAMMGTAAANSTLAASVAISPIATATLPPTPVPTLVPTIAVLPTATTSPPTAAPLPTYTPVSGQVTYVVQPGDNLFRIALRYGTTVSAIASANGIANPNLIKVGQTLRIPSTGVQPTALPGGETTYVVQPGDNLFRIALRYGLSYTTLAQYNGIANPALIRVGQVLRIPPR